MAKTDKEITSEIVCEYLRAWSGQGKEPTKWKDLSPLIEMVYKTVSNLENQSKSGE